MGLERMQNSKMRRYLVAIPCLIVFLLIIILSSNAEADSGDMTLSVELSSNDSVSSASMSQAKPEETSALIEDSALYMVAIDVESDAMKPVQTRTDSSSRDHQTTTEVYDKDNQFHYLDVNLLAFEHVNSSTGATSIWSKAMLANNEPKNENVEDPRIELTEDNEENSRENVLKADHRYHQWYADEATRIFINYQEEKTITNEVLDNADFILDQKAQNAETKYRFQKRDALGVEPKDRPPDLNKAKTIENRKELQPPENDRIVLIDPIPKLPLPMFSRIANPMANGSIRGEILEFIRANPGEHMSKIKRRFNLSTSSAVHHLNVLEKNGIILAHKDGKFKRYFANENGYRSTIDGEYKAIFSVLKNKNSRQIAMHLMSKPHSTLSEVSMVTGLNPSTIHWHAERMEDVKIISKSRDGKNVRYFIENTETVEKVIALLNT